MPTLQNIHGGSLVADLGQGLAVLRQGFGTPESREDRARKIAKEDATQEAINQALGHLTPGFAGPIANPNGTPFNPNVSAKKRQAALTRLTALDPKIGKAVQSVIASGNEQEQEAFKLESERGARQAAFVSKQPDFASKQKAIRSLATEAVARGEPVEPFIKRLNMSEPELDLELMRMKFAGTDIKTVLGEKFEPVTDSQGQVVAQRNTTTGRVVSDPRAPSTQNGLASAKTEILQDGTTIQAMPGGEVVVKNPAGEVVSGADRLKVLKAAQQSELNHARAKSGQKAAGAAAISRSEKAINSLGKIKTSIANIDQAIKLLDDGATTGPIVSRLPSIRSSSIALDNTQKAMGLDVIGSTTFGALSKGELDLALSKSLPTNMQPEALREWLVEKKAAQEKLSSYLENAAIFLGLPGNTSADWIAQQKELRKDKVSIEKLPIDDLIQKFRTK